jgi:Predicted transcriptional regulators
MLVKSQYAQKSPVVSKSADSVEKYTIMAKSPHSRFECSPGCAVEASIALIDGKWKSVVLFHLMDGTMRFNALRRAIPGVTQRMLTNQLREMEDDGLILRKVYAEVPPKVEYSLSPLGLSMKPILLALKAWGDANIGRFGKPKGTAENCP